MEYLKLFFKPKILQTIFYWIWSLGAPLTRSAAEAAPLLLPPSPPVSGDCDCVAEGDTRPAAWIAKSMILKTFWQSTCMFSFNYKNKDHVHWQDQEAHCSSNYHKRLRGVAWRPGKGQRWNSSCFSPFSDLKIWLFLECAIKHRCNKPKDHAKDQDGGHYVDAEEHSHTYG